MFNKPFATALLSASALASTLQDFTALDPVCADPADAHCTQLGELNDAIHLDLNYFHGILDTHIADNVAHSDDSLSSHGHNHFHSHSSSDDSSSDSHDHSHDHWSYGFSSDSYYDRDRSGDFAWDPVLEKFVYRG